MMSSQSLKGNKLARRLFVALAIMVVLASGIYFARQSGTNPHKYENDFSVFYFAASELLIGHDPYQEVLDPWTPYLYPPLFAELMLPLALLSLPVAAYLWFLISFSATVLATRMSAALVGLPPDQEAETPPGVMYSVKNTVSRSAAFLADLDKQKIFIAFLVSVILLRFILDNYKLGQVNLIITGLAVAHVYFYATNRKGLSVAALAFAVAFKLTPGLLLVYHLAKGRWRFAAICAVCSGLLMAASFLPFGSQAVATFDVFFNRTVRNHQGFDLAYGGNQSLRGFVARLTDEASAPTHPQVNQSKTTSTDDSVRQPSSPLTMALSAILLAVAIAAAVMAQSEVAAASPFFCCMVMLSPLSWKAHFVILILPVAFLVRRALDTQILSDKRLLIAALIAIFVFSDLTSRNLFGDPFSEWTDARSLVLAGAFVTYVAVVWQAVQQFVNLKRSRHSETTVNDYQSAQ